MDTQGKRVRFALANKPGGRVTATELARHLGITRSAVSQWWAATAGPRAPEARLPEISAYLSCNEQWLRTGNGMPFGSSTYLPQSTTFGSVHTRNDNADEQIFTLGEVAAAMFRAVSEVSDLDFQREPSSFPPLPGHAAKDQYDLIVRGTSIDRFARDGERVRCVSIQAPTIDLQSGDYVHVQRYRHGRSEVENTIKRAFFVGDQWELRFDSYDQRWAGQPPLTLGTGDDEQVEIIGIALYQFFPSPSRRRMPD